MWISDTGTEQIFWDRFHLTRLLMINTKLQGPLRTLSDQSRSVLVLNVPQELRRPSLNNSVLWNAFLSASSKKSSLPQAHFKENLTESGENIRRGRTTSRRTHRTKITDSVSPEHRYGQQCLDQRYSSTMKQLGDLGLRTEQFVLNYLSITQRIIMLNSIQIFTV